MNTNIEVMRELDELVEAARLLGVTQAKRGFGCHTDEDSRFERVMYESIDKHRAAMLAEIEALRAEVERLRTDGARAVQWAPGSAYWSDVLMELFGADARKGIDVLERRWQAALERADKLAEALEEIRHIANTSLWKENSNAHDQ